MLALLFQTTSCATAFICSCKCASIALQRMDAASRTKPNLEIEDVLRDRTLCFLAFAAFSVVIAYATWFWLIAVLLPLSYIMAKKAPSFLDAKAARELRSACDEQLDVMADIVAMGIRSGLSFDASIDLYCEKFDNALTEQLQRSRLEWKTSLASRQEALTSLAARVDSKALKRFSETSVQAIHHGSPLADMLDRFSSDIRERRKNAIERQIAKAPVKLLIPTGTCILPAMLILVMGPVMLQFIQTGF